MSNFPSVRPSLNLQFDSQPTPEDMTSHLASVGATFSRASIGTYTDANGLIQEASAGQARPNYSTAGVHEGLLIEESRVNLVKSSEDFSTTDWTKVGVSTTINQAIAPDGLAGSDKIVPSTTNTAAHVIQYTYAFGASATYSVYAKADGYDKFMIWTATVGKGYGFNLTNGTTFSVGNITDSTSASIENVGNGWYRCSIYIAETTATRLDIYILNSTTYEAYAGDGESGILIWGAQAEAGSFPTSYIPTIPTFSSRASTATYFDSDGVLQTASIDEARTDHKYIDGQWVEAGLLLEGASTNETPNSEGVLQNGGSRLDRDGTTISFFNGDSPNAYATNGSAGVVYLYETKGADLTGSTTYTTSLFVRLPDTNPYNVSHVNFQNQSNSYGGSTSNVFDLTNGTIVSSNSENATIEEFPDGWYRISITDTTTVSPSSFDWLLYPLDGSTTSDQVSSTGNGEDVIYIYAVQTEQGTQPTSYIATSGSTVTRSADVYTTATKTRSADVCYIDGTAFTDFYNQEQGTWYSNLIASGQVGTILDADSPSVDRFPQLGINATNKIQSSFVSFNDYTVDTISEGDELKISVTVTDGAQRNFYNGEFQEETTVANPKDINKLYIGDRDVGNSLLNGTIKKLIYFPRALSDNELIKLTR